MILKYCYVVICFSKLFQENGCAAQCSELKVGDVIMAVCGRSLVGLDHKDCVKVIAKAFRDKAIPYLDLTIAVENIS